MLRLDLLRTIVRSLGLLAAIILSTRAEAQNAARPWPAFRVEVVARRGGTTAVEGYVYNDGSFRLTDVRLRVEVLADDGSTVEIASGWVFGDLAPRGRGYFVVAIKRAGSAYRVSVLSFDVVSEEGLRGIATHLLTDRAADLMDGTAAVEYQRRLIFC